MRDKHTERHLPPARYREHPGSNSGFWPELLKSLVRDEQGAETLEYAMVAGLVIIGAIGLIGKVGVKVLAKWTSLSSSM